MGCNTSKPQKTSISTSASTSRTNSDGSSSAPLKKNASKPASRPAQSNNTQKADAKAPDGISSGPEMVHVAPLLGQKPPPAGGGKGPQKPGNIGTPGTSKGAKPAPVSTPVPASTRASTAGKQRAPKGKAAKQRAGTTVLAYDPGPPRAQYEARYTADNVSALHGLANACLTLAHSLREQTREMPALAARPASTSAYTLDRGVPWPADEYARAFGRAEGTRPYVLAAMISRLVWEAIADFSLFTAAAAKDLKAIASLPNHAPTDAKGIQLEEYLTSRLLRVHGAGGAGACAPGTDAFAAVRQSLVQPLKAAFGGKGVTDEQFDRFGVDVWNYAMKLRNQKAHMYATFHPGRKRTDYDRLQRAATVSQLLYYNAEAKRAYLSSEMGAVPGFPNAPKAASGQGAVVWFPEVTMLFPKDRLKDGTTTGVVFQAKYSQP
ncbi:hypothetical protein DFH27DRAFT_560378 [Peziza echinospora]|nr:hypothetical protein DFH27DRAFT_560378 [Peziza echinospora]